MGITIRKATQDDAVLINSMAMVVFPASYSDILSPGQLEYMLDWMYSVPNILKQMDEGHQYFLSEDTDYVGYASVQRKGTDLFHLQKLYVMPDHQGRGVGKLLFYGVVDYIKSVHPEHCYMELNVNRKNRAVGFYKKLGMEIDREGDFHIGNGYYMNDYIMRLAIE